MVAAQFHVRTSCGLEAGITDRRNAYATGRLIPNPPVRCCFWFQSQFQSSISLDFKRVLPLRCHAPDPPKPLLISCKSSRGSSYSGGGGPGPSSNAYDHYHDFLQASLLVSETITHFHMRRQGFPEEMTRGALSGKLFPIAVRAKESRPPDMSLIGNGLLRRFHNPTIFLKISCDGDFLLPIIVGAFAIEKLIDALRGDDNGDCPDQFQLVRNVAEKLGYEVKMVKITQRVVNTYFARLYFCKPGDNDILSVDARPSDAINVAARCQAPIYVSKQIVLTDAIKIGYGMGRARDTKPIYDVSLDSAAEGPDSLTEELDFVKNMHLAVKEERYIDAAMWRDKLTELRNSRNEH